jgi:transposase
MRIVLEHQGEHDSQYEAIRSIAAKFDCLGEALRNWVRQA